MEPEIRKAKNPNINTVIASMGVINGVLNELGGPIKAKEYFLKESSEGFTQSMPLR